MNEKKKLWIYIAIAYGVTALMSIVMYIGFRKEYDITAFVNTQMMYPACGVILGKLITKEDKSKLPMGAYITVLITTAVLIVISILSVLIPLDSIDTGAAPIAMWNLISQFPLLIGSIIAYIFFWTCGSEKRENAGMSHKNIGTSIAVVILFILLFLSRLAIGGGLEYITTGTSTVVPQLKELFSTATFWLTLTSLPVNFFFSFIAFFGEEYGWRYYLQPVMQKKLGKRAGVLLLGIVWAVWHICVDFMFYAKGYGPQAFVTQIVTCVVYAIFFGYSYMKTGNMWVPIIIHYINNNLAALFLGGQSDSMQNQVIEWSNIPRSLLCSILAALFIFAPIYNNRKQVIENDEA